MTDNTPHKTVDTEAVVPAGETETIDEHVILSDAEASAPSSSEDAMVTEEAANIDALNEALEAQKIATQEALDKALRAAAEMDNLRKRTERDIENAHKFALEKFVVELLPVFDSIELALSSCHDGAEIASIHEGLQLTCNMFTACFEKFNVSILAPVGEKFNPEQHEAVSMQEASESPAGHVISVIQKGCELNGRLVRPALVVVAK